MASPEDRIRQVAAYGKQVDFGKTAGDYGRYRAGYPDELYRRLEAFGVGLPGQRILDLGTGTGFLGRGFARRGCHLTAADISMPLMREARRLDTDASIVMAYARAKAEALPFANRTFDAVCAGQCWHWFDRDAAAAESHRVLRPGGTIGHRAFRLDSAARQRRRGHRTANRQAQPKMGARRRRWNLSAMAPRRRDCRLYRDRDPLLRRDGVLHP